MHPSEYRGSVQRNNVIHWPILIVVGEHLTVDPGKDASMLFI